MKKLLSSFFLLLNISTFSLLNAQITIGSGEQPNVGAILDLKDGTVGPNNETAKKGLVLPRVALQDYSKLQMGINGPDLTSEASAHTGLVVYNVNKDFNKCDQTSIPSGVYVWEGNEWVVLMSSEEYYSPTPPDLSSSIYEPNTYMVTTIGSASSVTIPIAKAFAVWNYWASEAGGKKLTARSFTGTLSTNIEWQAGMGQAGNANNAIVGTPTLSSTAIADSLTANITVPVTGELGNALINLSDENGILWSWHIWVTPEPSTLEYNEHTWLDRNLGATSATPASDGTIGLYYQWGRNIPIPGYTTFAGDTATITILPIEISDVLSPDGKGGSNALDYSIKNPKKFIVTQLAPFDWYSSNQSEWDTRWAEQVADPECPTVFYDIPSITNPCPKGWEVPAASNNNTESPWGSGLSTGNGGDFLINKGFNWTTAPNAAGYYPAVGRRGKIALLDFIGVDGNYWTASPYNSYAMRLKLNNGLISPKDSMGPLFGLSVRCVKE